MIWGFGRTSPWSRVERRSSISYCGIASPDRSRRPLGRTPAMTTPVDPQGPSGRALLRQLLSERNQESERAAEIDEQIRRTFERVVAVLVLDMVGFSRLSEKHGIIHYL